MEGLPLTRAYLESLTTNDLLEIADGMGLDTSNNPDRVLLIEELLEVASQDEDRVPDSQGPEVPGPALIEPVPLPKQYNISFIKVMIRDPLWAFVFWEIKASDKEQFEKADYFDGYYLKVSHLEGKGVPSQFGNEELFKVPVKPEDTARYLSLLPAFEEKTSWADMSQFKVEFCASLAGVETVLASSSPVKLPGLLELPSASGLPPVLRLSGYGDFHVLRKNERPPRVKRSEGENPNG